MASDNVDRTTSRLFSQLGTRHRDVRVFDRDTIGGLDEGDEQYALHPSLLGEDFESYLQEVGLERSTLGFGEYQQEHRPQTPRPISWTSEGEPWSEDIDSFASPRPRLDSDSDFELDVVPPIIDSNLNRPGPSRVINQTPASNTNPYQSRPSRVLNWTQPASDTNPYLSRPSRVSNRTLPPSHTNSYLSGPSRVLNQTSPASNTNPYLSGPLWIQSWAQSVASESSSVNLPAQRTPLTPVLELVPECIVCSETVSSHRYFTAPCGHCYCRNCLEDYVLLSVKDESSFPPQCCGRAFPMGLERSESFSSRLSPSVLSVLSNAALIRNLKAKAYEFSVPPKNRVYCPNPQCSIFLGSLIAPWTDASLSVPITCCSCGANVCLRCKGAAHPGSGCFFSPEMAEHQVRELAKEKKWQTCPRCNNLVERTAGCSHMVCRCKAEFCYGCGSDWNRGTGCVCGSQNVGIPPVMPYGYQGLLRAPEMPRPPTPPLPRTIPTPYHYIRTRMMPRTRTPTPVPIRRARTWDTNDADSEREFDPPAVNHATHRGLARLNPIPRTPVPLPPTPYPRTGMARRARTLRTPPTPIWDPDDDVDSEDEFDLPAVNDAIHRGPTRLNSNPRTPPPPTPYPRTGMARRARVPPPPPPPAPMSIWDSDDDDDDDSVVRWVSAALRDAGPAVNGAIPTQHALRGHALQGHALRGHALRGHALRGHAPRGLARLNPIRVVSRWIQRHR